MSTPLPTTARPFKPFALDSFMDVIDLRPAHEVRVFALDKATGDIYQLIISRRDLFEEDYKVLAQGDFTKPSFEVLDLSQWTVVAK